MNAFKYKSVKLSMLLFVVAFASCSKNFMEREPLGSLNENILATPSGVKGVLIGAYSLLDNSGALNIGMDQYSGPHIFSSVASDDAHVGTIPNAQLGAIEGYTVDANHPYLPLRWGLLYAGVQRANNVLRILPKVTTLSTTEAIQIKAEAQFLRAYYHFELVKMWKNVPYIDETVNFESGNFLVGNTEPVWPKIEADLQFAADNLTETKPEVGRVNSWAARAYLAKAYMFQHKYDEAQPLLNEIITNGMTANGLKYELLDKYYDNFYTQTKHGAESVFTAQNAVYDGSAGAQGNNANAYNGPYGSSVTPCCGWLQPSFDLANAYQTEAVTGLPKLYTFQSTPITTDQGIPSSDPFVAYAGTLDPRLDWVLGRRGIPFLDWGINPGASWIRQQLTGGPYTVKKQFAWQYRAASDRDQTATNNPFCLMRFADVILWAAEVEVEIGSLQKAEDLVNQIRQRAANPDGFVKKYIDNSDPLKGFTSEPAANYKVGLYSGEFEANGKDYARDAVRFERRLEFGMEHHRFFDLQRYDNGTGYMADLLNAYLQAEKTVPNYNNQGYMPNAVFIEGKNEIYPIPQPQIDLTIVNGVKVLKQNPGYN